MCGIAGFTQAGPCAETVLASMLAPIAHRGPDDRGVWVNGGIAFGHVRLAVIAPDGGRQPRVDAATGDALVFNGELYGFRQHADWLRARGVVLRDGSDTEVLFQLIRLLGVEATLERIDGMFAFAFVDGASGRIHLVRDRFGEKPLFYAVDGTTLVFASELAALRCHPSCRGAGIDEAAIHRYLMLDYVPAPATGFRGLSKLRPAEHLVFGRGTVSTRCYWLPVAVEGEREKARGASTEDHVRRFEALLDSSIETRLVADVPVGLFLSGGIDSALVAARARRIAGDIRSFTIRFEDASYDESPHAQSVARHLGIDHAVFPVTGADVLQAVDTVLDKLDEPFADSSIVPTYLLCAAARREVTVALGGDGGDELFAGYMPFQAMPAARLLAALPSALRPRTRALLKMLPQADGYMSTGFKLDQLLNGLGERAAAQPFHWMAAFSRDDLAALADRGDDNDALAGVVDVESALATPRDPVERLQYLFCRLYLANDILTKVDRASMYNSLEVRAPFLSRPLAEFALSLPRSLKIRRGTTKRLLRILGRRLLPPEIAARSKHGFALPVAGMMRGPLRERVAQTVLDPGNPMNGLLRDDRVETLVRDHLGGRRDHRKRLWSLFVLFHWAATAAAAPQSMSRG